MGAEIIKTIRQRHQLTQSDMAEILGVSRSLIGQIESGYRPLSDFVRAQVAVNFRIDDDLRDFIANLSNLKDLETS